MLTQHITITGQQQQQAQMTMRDEPLHCVMTQPVQLDGAEHLCCYQSRRRMTRRVVYGSLLLLLAVICLLPSSPSRLSSSSSCCLSISPPSLLSVSGARLPDCCCELETIESGNDDALYQTLQKLREYTYFRIFKVDLHSDCPFWRDDSKCARRNCAVGGECSSEEVPACWRDEEGEDEKSDPVDFTMSKSFHPWRSSDDDDLWIVQPAGSVSYINMQLNPEGYTGYEGDAPHRIWEAIYNQNCFASPQQIAEAERGRSNNNNNNNMTSLSSSAATSNNDTSSTTSTGVLSFRRRSDFSSLCFEQRVFYRLLSGLHASISCHIANSYPVGDVDPHVDIHAPATSGALIGPNVTVYDNRVGHYPERITNLYFAFVFMLRAVNKASEVLREADYSTGNDAEDAMVRTLVERVLESPLVRSCSNTQSFDESIMFTGTNGNGHGGNGNVPSGPSLRKQLRHAFRNISRIIDCVGCEKCKLHGKLQILGLGTALKILFNDQSHSTATSSIHGPSSSSSASSELKLERNEIMSLVVTLSKFSHAIKVMRQMEEQKREMSQEDWWIPPRTLIAMAMGVLVTLATLIATLVYYVVHRSKDRAKMMKEIEIDRNRNQAAGARGRVRSRSSSRSSSSSSNARTGIQARSTSGKQQDGTPTIISDASLTRRTGGMPHCASGSGSVPPK